MKVWRGAQSLLQHGRALDTSARDPGSTIALPLLSRSNRSWVALAEGSAFVWRAHRNAAGKLCCESTSPGWLGSVKRLYCAINIKLPLFGGTDSVFHHSLSLRLHRRFIAERMDRSGRGIFPL